MMRKLLILTNLLIVCSTCAPEAHAQNFEWAKSMGGGDFEMGSKVALDAVGNLYVTGVINSATADFDPGPGIAILTSAGSADVFLTKYDPSGNYLWAKSMGGSSVDEAYAIAVDAMGNVCITGRFQQTADFDPGSGVAILTSYGGNDVFLAKYDSNGNYIWAKGMGGTDSDEGNDLVVDGTGNVYVTGYFQRSADFDPSAVPLTSAGGSDIFLAKYDSSGNYLWAKSMGGSSTTNVDYGRAVAVSTTGNVYVAGIFNSPTADLDPGPGTATLTQIGGYDAFLAKYDTNGNYVWAVNIGGSDADWCNAVAVDTTGNVYITGEFGGTADFDPGAGNATFTAAGGQDIFLARYDSSGNYVWAKTMGGSSGFLRFLPESGYDVAMDAAGNLYVTGTFISATADFNPGAGTAAVLTSAGGQDVFAAKYDPNGNYLWAKNMGGSGTDNGYGLAVDGTGSVYITGRFDQAADFDPGTDTATLVPAGSFDVFVVKLACNDTSSFYLPITACGGSYTLNGAVYTTNGIYTQHFPNAAGCDSTVTLDLTFYQVEPVITVNKSVLGAVSTYTTYQWIKNTTDIPGATDSTYTVTENANYQVRVTNADGCEGTSTVYTVTNVGVEYRNGTRYIRVYPNPANDIIYINSPVTVTAVLSDIEGRMCRKVEDAKQIDIKNLVRGTYLLLLSDKEGRLVKAEKIIKQ